MAKTQKPKKVRYQVLGPVFVEGNLFDPQGRKDVFVHADPGLEGKHLKLAPEKAEPAPEKTDGGSGSTSGAGNGDSGDAGPGAPEGSGQSVAKDAKQGQPTKPAA